MRRYINLLVEDDLQLNILSKLLQDNFPNLTVNRVFGRRGKNYIRQNLAAHNQAARITPYLVLVDLDDDDCPPSLVESWISFPKNTNFVFRIAVREAEAWLISDRANLSAFMGVSKDRITAKPETLSDPKAYLINLAKRSRKRNIREDLIPEGQATVGRNYNACLADFVYQKWDANKACLASRSLSGLMAALERLNEPSARPS